MRLSRRLDWRGKINAISRAVERRRASGEQLIDLTSTNPTTVGFDPPPELAGAVSAGSLTPYHPDPRGSREARVALADWLSRHGAEDADPEEIFLASSTSEAYGWILKLLCDPDDQVLRFAPTYPLLDHLCALESVRVNTVELETNGDRWNIVDDEALRDEINRSKALILVHPNNPTGHFLSPAEVRMLSAAAVHYGAAIIADEVFFEYGGVERRRVAYDSECLTFSLGGLSKSAALPHWKLGWIRITGPQEQKLRAIEAMDLIADTYLPVAGPVQHALPDILAMSGTIRRSILERLENNLRTIDEAIYASPSIRRMSFEGGWTALLRVPVFEGEEKLVIDLIGAGVMVHPGYFYDFPSDGWIVVSLLTRQHELQSGMEIITQHFRPKP